MILQLGLLFIVRNLSSDRVERRRLASALISLTRHRSLGLMLLGPFVARFPNLSIAKFLLWQRLACAVCLRPRLTSLDQSVRVSLLETIHSTQAYQDALHRLLYDRNGFLQRGEGYQTILVRFRHSPPTRLVVFHHYDSGGWLPSTWQELLLEFQANGWQVLLSTSSLQSVVSEQLQQAGVQIAYRFNVGRCLGAYRDLSLLLLSIPEVCSCLRSLVLINDSNLPVQSPQVLLMQLQRWIAEEELLQMPVLAGLTDSAERDRYHLQSFFLYANRALISHSAWLRFWLQLSIDGSKDDLINQGEIGLSQALLSEGVLLKPSYALVEGLLQDPAMADELRRYDIFQPQHVNQSLFAWRSLLKRGYPFVKKHVLFRLLEQEGKPIAVAELARLLPPDRFDLIKGDIQQLLISQYSSGSTPLNL